MKKIILDFDDALVDAAYRKADRENTTLDKLFCQWLEDYAGAERQPPDPAEGKRQAERAMAAIRELQKYIDTSGAKPTRDEMNAR